MSRKRLTKFKRLAQRAPSKDSIMGYIAQMFPVRGKRTDRKMASLQAFYAKRG